MEGTMRAGKWMTIATITIGLTASAVSAQTHIDSVNVKTKIKADRLAATDGGKIRLSSVHIDGGSQIPGGNLEVDSKTTVDTVTAQGEGAEVNLGSLLLNDASRVGSLDGKLKTSVHADNVEAAEGASIDVGGVHLTNAQIGSLTIDGKIKVKANNLTAEEGAQLGIATLLIENAQAESIHIEKMKAHVEDVTVEEGGQAYFSSIKMANGASAGNIRFEGSSKVDSDVTVKAGTLLNVGSAVLDGTQIGDISVDYHVKTDHVDMSDESEVVIGGMNF